jgi:hypothetical protein
MADVPVGVRRGGREARPSAWGIGADRRRAASVAQIVDIDALAW